jgi:hypothetical protein
MTQLNAAEGELTVTTPLRTSNFASCMDVTAIFRFVTEDKVIFLFFVVRDGAGK